MECSFHKRALFPSLPPLHVNICRWGEKEKGPTRVILYNRIGPLKLFLKIPTYINELCTSLVFLFFSHLVFKICKNQSDPWWLGYTIEFTKYTIEVTMQGRKINGCFPLSPHIWIWLFFLPPSPPSPLPVIWIIKTCRWGEKEKEPCISVKTNLTLSI